MLLAQFCGKLPENRHFYEINTFQNIGIQHNTGLQIRQNIAVVRMGLELRFLSFKIAGIKHNLMKHFKKVENEAQ